MRCATCKMDRPPYRYGGQVNKNKNNDGDSDMAVGLSLRSTDDPWQKLNTTSYFTHLGYGCLSLFPPTTNIIQMADCRRPAIVRL